MGLISRPGGEERTRRDHSGVPVRLTDAVGIGGAGLALFLGIPALALQLAWAGGAAPLVVATAGLLVGTACSAWRDLERGHVGKLSASLTGASLVALAYMVWPT